MVKNIEIVNNENLSIIDSYKVNFVATEDVTEVEKQGLRFINQFQIELFKKYIMETIK